MKAQILLLANASCLTRLQANLLSFPAVSEVGGPLEEWLGKCECIQNKLNSE